MSSVTHILTRHPSGACLSLHLVYFMKTSVRRDQGPTLHQDDFVWTSCTCNNPISKSDHILRHWGVRMSTYGFGERRGHNSTLSNIRGGVLPPGSPLGLFLPLPGSLARSPVPKRQVSPWLRCWLWGSAVARTLQPWPWLDARESLPGAHLFFLCQLHLCHHHCVSLTCWRNSCSSLFCFCSSSAK